MNKKFNDITFFRLWRNLVINRVIFKYIELYKNNRVKEFNLKSLREYGEREFICKLVIKSSQNNIYETYNNNDGSNLILKGDLPEYGVLKELDLTYDGIILTGDCVPKGVEILTLSYRDINKIQLSELPSTIQTISNVNLKSPYINNEIPLNIKSLSFLYINPNEFYDIKLPPLSITTLDLDCLKYYKDKLPNTSVSILNSFIPSSVKNLTIFYEEKYKLNLPVIPSTVDKLTLILGNGYYDFRNGLIPIGINDLTINGTEYGVNFHLQENKLPESLTKLNIIFGWESTKDTECKIRPNSIPSSVTDLKVHFNEYPKSYKGIFPSNLTNLDICCKFNKYPPPKVSRLLPKLSDIPMGSMKYLKIDNKVINK